MLDATPTKTGAKNGAFQVASAQRARAHGEAMMKRCREAKLGGCLDRNGGRFPWKKDHF